MITAMQSARHKAATHLLSARESLREAVSLICWKNNEPHEIQKLIVEIDAHYAKLVPNTPAA